MTYIAKPKLHHPTLGCNAIGFTRRDYEGKISTLCAGCGHDSISAAIIQACWELDIEPHRVAKLSGIGCSSKTPDYFLGQSHGFNTVHGRMPSVLTGANLANSDLLYLGVSGDGDSASIGIGQFVHAIRRGVNMVYIVENNGVYGLTKGQFSATADQGSKSKHGVVNTDSPLDLVGLAMQLGASFVARSFSGDKAQLVPLIKAAIAHKGAAFIDVISPCVAFNNHAGSTKSYEYVREHNEAVNRLDFIDVRAEITVDYAEGELIDVTQHDGSIVRLRKLSANFNAARPRRRDELRARAPGQGRSRDRLAVRRSGVARPARAFQHDRYADQPAWREESEPRRGDTGEDQRVAALTVALTTQRRACAEGLRPRLFRQVVSRPAPRGELARTSSSARSRWRCGRRVLSRPRSPQRARCRLRRRRLAQAVAQAAAAASTISVSTAASMPSRATAARAISAWRRSASSANCASTRTFDLIVCSDVLHYVPTPELKRGLRGIAEMLDGVAFLELFTSRDAPDGDKHGFIRALAEMVPVDVRAGRTDRLRNALLPRAAPEGLRRGAREHLTGD